jgi:hypothetical protein
MATWKPIRPKARPRFRVGDWVSYVSSGGRLTCKVIGYVGTRGFDAVHYYRLSRPIWYGTPMEYDFPETGLEPATDEDLADIYPPEERTAHATQPR